MLLTNCSNYIYCLNVFAQSFRQTAYQSWISDVISVSFSIWLTRPMLLVGLGRFWSNPAPSVCAFSFKTNPLLIPDELWPERRRSRLRAHQSFHLSCSLLICYFTVCHTLPATTWNVLECDKVAGDSGGVTDPPLAVTIHPWMDLTVHLSHVQSLASATGNRRKRTGRTRDEKIPVGFLSL